MFNLGQSFTRGDLIARISPAQAQPQAGKALDLAHPAPGRCRWIAGWAGSRNSSPLPLEKPKSLAALSGEFALGKGEGDREKLRRMLLPSLLAPSLKTRSFAPGGDRKEPGGLLQTRLPPSSLSPLHAKSLERLPPSSQGGLLQTRLPPPLPPTSHEGLLQTRPPPSLSSSLKANSLLERLPPSSSRSLRRIAAPPAQTKG
jgi:hypothetical protein